MTPAQQFAFCPVCPTLITHLQMCKVEIQRLTTNQREWESKEKQMQKELNTYRTLAISLDAMITSFSKNITNGNIYKANKPSLENNLSLLQKADLLFKSFQIIENKEQEEVLESGVVPQTPMYLQDFSAFPVNELSLDSQGNENYSPNITNNFNLWNGMPGSPLPSGYKRKQPERTQAKLGRPSKKSKNDKK